MSTHTHPDKRSTPDTFAFTYRREGQHVLCYCGTAGVQHCDFCSGLREGTVDDYATTIQALRAQRDALAAALRHLVTGIKGTSPQGPLCADLIRQAEAALRAGEG